MYCFVYYLVYPKLDFKGQLVVLDVIFIKYIILYI